MRRAAVLQHASAGAAQPAILIVHGLHDGNKVGAVQIRLLLVPSLHGQGLCASFSALSSLPPTRASLTLSHDGPQERQAGANRCSQELLCVTDLPHRVPAT